MIEESQWLEGTHWTQERDRKTEHEQDTEPAADVAGMTDEEFAKWFAYLAAGMTLGGDRYQKMYDEMMRRLAQPALDLDALRAAVVEAFDEHWDGHALPTFDAVSAVFDEWGKRNGTD